MNNVDKEKLKVLVVSKGLGINGVSNVIFSYYRYINKKKIQMDFVSGTDIDEMYKKEVEINGNKIYVLSGRDSNPLGYIIKLASIIKNGEYSVVHVHGNSAMIVLEMIAAFIGGAKKRIAHSHNTTCDHLLLEKVMRPLFYTFTNVRFACGEAAGEWLFGKRKFYILKNGLNLMDYRFSTSVRESVRNKLNLKDKYVIGHVGVFNYQKNHKYLIELFSSIEQQNSNAILLLIGDGELLEETKEEVKRLRIDDKVIFYGLTDKVVELMMAMDVFVLPSRFEGVPCVLIEAQATGLSCIASENVSDEVNISGSVKFLSLQESKERWIDDILSETNDNRLECSEYAISRLKKEGYDIKQETKKIEELYLS